MKASTILQFFLASVAIAQDGEPQAQEVVPTRTYARYHDRRQVPTSRPPGWNGNGGGGGSGGGRIPLVPTDRPTIGNCAGLSRNGCWSNPLCEWDGIRQICIAWI